MPKFDFVISNRFFYSDLFYIILYFITMFKNVAINVHFVTHFLSLHQIYLIIFYYILVYRNIQLKMRKHVIQNTHIRVIFILLLFLCFCIKEKNHIRFLF